VKNFAKLVLFFCLSFTGILVLGGILGLLQEWAGLAVLFPPDPEGFSVNGAAEFGAALPAAFYLSILLSLSYAARRRMIYPLACAVILVLSFVLSAGAFFGLDMLNQMGGIQIRAKAAPPKPAKPGLMLVSSQGVVQTVFLEDPYKPDGARVLLSRGQFGAAAGALGGQAASLYYQRQANSPVSQVPLFFAGPQSRFFRSIDADFARTFRVFSAWFKEGPLTYGIYAGSLALFLLSLGCLVNISFWSLANLFFGALIFRGALALEAFLNLPDIHELLSSFAGRFIPESLINPLIFCSLGALILLYSALVYLARGRRAYG
jgi:hypothetical protein